jgi:hypothetical protein
MHNDDIKCAFQTTQIHELGVSVLGVQDLLGKLLSTAGNKELVECAYLGLQD